MDYSTLKANYTGRIIRPGHSLQTLVDDTVLLDLELNVCCTGNRAELDGRWRQVSGSGHEVKAAWMGYPKSVDDLAIAIRYEFLDLNFVMGVDLQNLHLAPEEMIEALLNTENLLLQAPLGDPDLSPVIAVPVPEAHDNSLYEVLRLRRTPKQED